jgi:hypothetical protein
MAVMMSVRRSARLAREPRLEVTRGNEVDRCVEDGLELRENLS